MAQVSKVQKEIEERNSKRFNKPKRGVVPEQRMVKEAEDRMYFNFLSSPIVEVHGTQGKTYDIRFYDKNTEELLKEHLDVVSGEWVQADEEYYIEWAISITDKDTKEHKVYNNSPKGKKIFITFESNALGDTIAWLPVVDKFRELTGADVTCSTFHNNLFETVYPDLNFMEKGKALEGMEMAFRIGWFGDGRPSPRNKYDCHERNLQEMCCDILGIDYQEVGELMPKIKKSVMPRMVKEKYVLISTCSTAQFKYWNRAGGWQEIVNYLLSKKYKVVNIGKMPNNLHGVVNLTGKRDMDQLINLFHHSEFFIGLPSGLSWLGWGLKKKCIMITGISEHFCEFQNDIYRVENLNVCHGCFNWTDGTIFDRGNWLWCPKHEKTDRHFECTTQITPSMVKKKIAMVEKHIKNKIPVVLDKEGNLTSRKTGNIICKRGE